jgi:hypothetical protein
MPNLFVRLYDHYLLRRAARQHWWCAHCHRWRTQDEIRQQLVDDVCVEVCKRCGTVCVDHRHTGPEVPS